MSVCAVQTGRLAGRNSLLSVPNVRTALETVHGFKATTLSLRLMYLKRLSFLRRRLG